MEENKKRVSVAMAAYNGLPYIREQVISILKNLTAEDELVISDDGSTDKTQEFLAEIAKEDARVRVVQGKNSCLLFLRIVVQKPGHAPIS